MSGVKSLHDLKTLCEVRDEAKLILGSEYAERIAPYKHILKQVMKSNSVDEINAVLMISKTAHFQESQFSQMMYMALLYDCLEEKKSVSP